MILDGVVRSERRRKRGEKKEKRNQTKDNGGSVGMNREKCQRPCHTPCDGWFAPYISKTFSTQYLPGRSLAILAH